MKKGIVIGTLAVLLVAVIVTERVQLAMADPDEPGMMKAKAMTEMGSGCMMMSSTGKMMCGCPMHGMMMKSMMGCQMVAIEDGGVVVMHCGKMTKYDKDLNMVKEVEMKMDVEAMKKTMTQMMEACPMCKKMTEKCEMMEKTGTMEKPKMMEKQPGM